MNYIFALRAIYGSEVEERATNALAKHPTGHLLLFPLMTIAFVSLPLIIGLSQIPELRPA
jgi:hypothetical protein